MFEIKVANNDVTGGSISVGWCVDAETLKTLSDHKIKNPYVVIVVAPEGDNYYYTKEYRKVVPLKDLLTYVEFRCAGKNKIWAFIPLREGKAAKSKYLARSGNGFSDEILDNDGSGWSYNFGYHDANRNFICHPTLSSEPISVEVPVNCFAPEPSDLEKSWVNWLFPTKCLDQCEFRRRRLFAYTVQPFIMLFNMMVRTLLTLVALLVGMRGFNVQWMLHPLRDPFSDVIELFSGGTVFVSNNSEVSVWKRYVLVPLMPPILAALGGLGYLFHRLHLWKVPFIAACVLLTLGLVVVLGLYAWGKFTNYMDRRAEEAANAPLWYLEEEEMNMLVCNGEPRPLTVDALPAKKRTIRLRFQDLKSRVCRPFSA